MVQLSKSPHNFSKAYLTCVDFDLDFNLPDSVAVLALQTFVPEVHWLSIYLELMLSPENKRYESPT